ncbi:MAG: hypothetical protein O3C40_08985 [Planctomycetota bacterium]|nr:hypothetical protein [Planctomycetota bacterium]
MPVEQNHLGQLLYEAGWLPSGQRLGSARHDDLLSSMLEAWEDFDLSSLPVNTRRRAEKTRSWLADQRAAGARLTSLNIENSRAAHWLGERLLWWPQGRPSGSRIGIASSRLGRRLDTQADWFTVFRAACSKIDRDHDVLLTAAATTPDPYVRRAAELFGVRVVSLKCPRESESIHAWFKRVRQLKAMHLEAIHRAYLSPELWPSRVVSAHPMPLAKLPVRDQAVVAICERLLVFHLRRGGHVEKLVRARLNDLVWPTASVFLALGEDLVDRKLADDLLDRGAVGWVVLDTLRHEAASHRGSPTIQNAPIVELPSSGDWQWLTHSTRAQSDGWPDQCRSDYLDELLLNRAPSDHSAFAAIRRIVTMQRLVATSRIIRGNTEVVCLTAVPLADLPQLRSFRSHLARWDFEPYGICIRRDWLERRRCLPVRYGDDSLWESMAPQDRPLFQVQTSRSHRSGREIDWSIEREWRHVGDVDLGELPSDAGLIFVPTRAEAEQLATISRWPVTVLGP